MHVLLCYYIDLLATKLNLSINSSQVYYIIVEEGHSRPKKGRQPQPVVSCIILLQLVASCVNPNCTFAVGEQVCGSCGTLARLHRTESKSEQPLSFSIKTIPHDFLSHAHRDKNIHMCSSRCILKISIRVSFWIIYKNTTNTLCLFFFFRFSLKENLFFLFSCERLQGV